MTEHADGNDIRPVLVFIWWPIVLIAMTGGAVLLIGLLLGGAISSDPLPIVIIAILTLAGLAGLPLVIASTRAQFRGRGFRGFWRAFRRTDWGEGADTSV